MDDENIEQVRNETRLHAEAALLDFMQKSRSANLRARPTTSGPKFTTTLRETTPSTLFKKHVDEDDAREDEQTALPSPGPPPGPCSGGGGCVTQQWGNQNHTGIQGSNPTGIIIIDAHASGHENWACSRAIRYTYSASGWSGRQAFNATQGYGDECGALPNPIAFWYEPSDADLNAMIAYMDSPPDVSGTCVYQVTFFLSMSRDRSRSAEGNGWLVPEEGSSVYLCGASYISI